MDQLGGHSGGRPTTRRRRALWAAALRRLRSAVAVEMPNSLPDRPLSELRAALVGHRAARLWQASLALAAPSGCVVVGVPTACCYSCCCCCVCK
eukprot:1314364-Alexandrium_andersonii.AAC.1